MAVFHSWLAIMISHGIFSFSHGNFNFSYSDLLISRSDFPISHSDFSISHIGHWNSIGDFELNLLLSCLACHRGPEGKPKLDLKRMPFGLIEYQIEFFSCTNVMQVFFVSWIKKINIYMLLRSFPSIALRISYCAQFRTWLARAH